MNNHVNTHYRNIDTGNDQWAGTARKLAHHSQMAISLAHRLRAFADPSDHATIETIDKMLDVFDTVEKLTRASLSRKSLTPSQY